MAGTDQSGVAPIYYSEGRVMEIINECRYLYLVPAGSEWCVVEHYGCCTAVSMADARRHLRCHPGVNVVRVRLGAKGCIKADFGSQKYRKKLYDSAINDRSAK